MVEKISTIASKFSTDTLESIYWGTWVVPHDLRRVGTKKDCWKTTVSCTVCDNLIASSVIFCIWYYCWNITESKIRTLVGFIIIFFSERFIMWPDICLILEAKQGLRMKPCFRIWKLYTDFFLFWSIKLWKVSFKNPLWTCLKLNWTFISCS